VSDGDGASLVELVSELLCLFHDQVPERPGAAGGGPLGHDLVVQGLFAHRAHPGGPLVLPEKLGRLIEQRNVGGGPAAGLAPERGPLGRFLPSGRRRPNRR
jgi:hypothetical protein